MNSISGAGNFPIFALLFRRVQQLGYQVSGTEIVRPSIKETDNESGENATFATRSSALNAKMPIPFL